MIICVYKGKGRERGIEEKEKERGRERGRQREKEREGGRKGERERRGGRERAYTFIIILQRSMYFRASTALGLSMESKLSKAS